MASLPERPDNRLTNRLLVVAALLLAFTTACGSGGSEAGSGTTTTATPTELQGITRPQPLKVGAVSMPEVAPDGTSKPFAFKAPKGEVLFVAFGYTNCPDVCPTTLSDIKKAVARLGDDGKKVGVAFATVDPERDTPEVMNEYLGSFTDEGHPLRSTDEAEFQAAQDAFGITSSVEKKPDGTVEVGHTARSFVVDDAGQVAVEWSFGTNYKTMAADLRILLDRAG